MAVDTLVHNFLHRTGILKRLKAEHPYGVALLPRAGGCADIISCACPPASTPASSIRPSRKPSLALCSMPSGATALATGWMSATAIASTIEASCDQSALSAISHAVIASH